MRTRSPRSDFCHLFLTCCSETSPLSCLPRSHSSCGAQMTRHSSDEALSSRFWSGPRTQCIPAPHTSGVLGARSSTFLEFHVVIGSIWFHETTVSEETRGVFLCLVSGPVVFLQLPLLVQMRPHVLGNLISAWQKQLFCSRNSSSKHMHGYTHAVMFHYFLLYSIAHVYEML